MAYLKEEMRVQLRIELLKNIKEKLPELKEMLAMAGDREAFYRFYHQSFKVYRLQQATERIVSLLKSLLPEQELNEWFKQIIKEGTGKIFQMSDNDNWLAVTRPIMEANFHAVSFLELAICYGEELESPPAILPSGWAALLYLYDLR